MQLCSSAEMRASFKLNFFVFHNVHQKKIYISSVFFLFLFFMSNVTIVSLKPKFFAGKIRPQM